jgi:hypothetical protein
MAGGRYTSHYHDGCDVERGVALQRSEEPHAAVFLPYLLLRTLMLRLPSTVRMRMYEERRTRRSIAP